MIVDVTEVGQVNAIKSALSTELSQELQWILRAESDLEFATLGKVDKGSHLVYYVEVKASVDIMLRHFVLIASQHLLHGPDIQRVAPWVNYPTKSRINEEVVWSVELIVD